MDDAKAQLAEKLKKANNVLVTVSRDPSVDQLASCIALALLLNKQGKHAAAVFSGNVPSTLEFLQPEETLEKNTDSLRDFIVSLDKSKADKLRYKVEDNVVRIFITPYRTSISEADLTFTQGDFNVDLMVALGVRSQEDLDQAITAHGRILHDATVATINTSEGGELGTINWTDTQASSLSELVTDLAKMLDDQPELIDGQIATALLTGIVAETERFSNEKTTSQTMSASAVLLSAGANQQLVATKLADGVHGSAPIRNAEPSEAGHHDDGNGLLEINHTAPEEPAATDIPEYSEEPPVEESPEAGAEAQPDQDQSPEEQPPAGSPPESGGDQQAPAEQSQEPHSNIHVTPSARMIVEPPSLGTFLSPTEQGALDPLGMPLEEPPLMFDNKRNDVPSGAPPGPPPASAATAPPPFAWPPAAAAPPPAPAPAPPAPTPLAPPPSPVMPAAAPPSIPPTPAPAPQAAPVPEGLPPAWQPPASAPQPPQPDPAPWIPPPAPQPMAAPSSPNGQASAEAAGHTLAELEQSVGSPHVGGTGIADQAAAAPESDTSLDAARDEVSRALTDSNAAMVDEPIQALGAQPLGSELHPAAQPGPYLDDILAGHPQPGQLGAPLATSPAAPVEPPPDSQPPLPPSSTLPPSPPQVFDSNAPAPPPVPPPIPFQFGNPQQPQ